MKDLTHLTPAHISLPRQRTGQSRGFAFIEFGSYSQASNTVKDFNSKKAIATAFLLQSNRRKLFQNSMRQRQLKILGLFLTWVVRKTGRCKRLNGRLSGRFPGMTA